MDDQKDKNQLPSPPGKPLPKPIRSNSVFWLLLILVAVMAVLYFSSDRTKRSEITYGVFRIQLDNKNIAKLKIQGSTAYGEFKTPPPKLEPKFIAILPPYASIDESLDHQLREQLGADYEVAEPSDNTFTALLVYLLVSVALFAGLWFMFRRARDSIFTGGLMGGFSKSGARRYDAGDKSVTFDDVAGLEGVKHELEEVVEFLKNPEKFQRLGARVPKGILLMGPPGAGKTLLARAVAGEAGVPFYSINGSEFIQMFVGVGAGRVRDLFNTAKESAPSILFIDEIDAVGRHRGAGIGGGHDEREQTLNQILSEMDGFTQTVSVIVMAASNRPDVLDPALLRPGRFDRHITVDRPNLKGRQAIFKVHSRDVPLAPDVDLERLAAGTVGLTGADIQNLVNEAALWASRNDKKNVDMADFEYARDKVLMGAKREEVLSGKEKSMTAYHESGHTLLAWLMPSGDRVHKVSIIPRGRSLGATQLLPEEDRLNISESELHIRLAIGLGGRAAEKMIFDEFSAGAENDLNNVTQLARRMVTYWGMSDRLGPVAFRDSEDHPFLGKEMTEPRRYSEHTAQLIDEEISRILHEASDKAFDLLTRNRDKLEILAKALEKSETLDEADIEELIGPAAYKKNDADVKDTK
ncbi:MAG: ATP-dependent zinc metalloprotease FtsH [Thermoguttaceae bacterium]|jgi:cell division protease FtsH